MPALKAAIAMSPQGALLACDEGLHEAMHRQDLDTAAFGAEAQ